MSSTRAEAARALADAFLCGPWTASEMAARARQALGSNRRIPWLESLAQRTLETFAQPHRIRFAVLQSFIADSAELRRSRIGNPGVRREVDRLKLPFPVMHPTPSLAGKIAVPELTTPAALAAWLELRPNELEWFADNRGLLTRCNVEQPLRHYRFAFREKSANRRRLLEVPKPRLRALQRRILHGILDAIPVHPAAHAFRPKRSVHTCLAPHVGRHVLLTIDLRSFFPSIHAARIHALFRALGYPERVARDLSGLCTTRTPDDILTDHISDFSERLRLRSPHLPQGAPTSPAIANLCAYRLDCRLAGLAGRFNATYTRYADDLIVSGDRTFERELPRFRVWAGAILLDEGFAIQHRKTRVLPNSQRQQAAGLVVNAKCNVPRDEYDTLRATLFNCIRNGPHAQNRDNHPQFRDYLRGRIAWVGASNANRKGRLMSLFERIPWNDQ